MTERQDFEVEEVPLVKRMRKDGDAIITSVDTITQTDWKDFVNRHWDSLMVEGTTLLVLTGVHGKPDGKLGEVDPFQIKEDQPMKDHLLKIKKDHSVTSSIRIVLMDIGDVCRSYVQKGTLDKDDLSRLKDNLKNQIVQWERLIGRKFTVLLFAYCHTQWNVITDLLRLDSMCSRLILERDLYELYGRRMSWSEEQMEALQWVIDNPKEPVLFTGDYGTGKTVLAAGMRNVVLMFFLTNYSAVLVSHFFCRSC